MRLFLILSSFLIYPTVSAQRKSAFDCPIPIQKARTHFYVFDGYVKPRAFMGIDTGNMIVFKLGQLFDCCGGGHCAAEGKLLWAIEKEKTSFTIKVQRQDSLSALMTYYMLGWHTDVYKLISAEGEIRGKFIKNKWIIEGEMRLYLKNLQGESDKVIDEILDGDYIKWKRSKKLKNARKFFTFD